MPLVTGAGSGIGDAISDALHERGDDLVLLARNEQRAEDLRAAVRRRDLRVADLGDFATVDDAVADVDRLDSVMQLPASWTLGPVGDLPLEHWPASCGSTWSPRPS